MTVLQAAPLSLMFLLGIVFTIGASELGRYLARFETKRKIGNEPTLESSALGLLALMIGFTFAMGLSHFDARREAVLHEANTISTSALRARMLPDPYSAQSLDHLRQYVQVRISLLQKPPSVAALKESIDQSNIIQELLWKQARNLINANDNMVPTGLYIQSLNEMFDAQESRLTVVFHRVPDIVIIGLYGIAFAAFAFIGYAEERYERGRRFLMYAMSLLISGVILIILDLDRAGAGFINVSQQPIVDTLNLINSFKD